MRGRILSISIARLSGLGRLSLHFRNGWIDRNFPDACGGLYELFHCNLNFDPINFIPRVLLQSGLAEFDTEMQLILNRNQHDFRMDS